MSADARVAKQLAADSWGSYRHLADTAIDVVLEATLQTEMVWVSPSVTEVLGWQPAELVGRYAADIVHPDDVAEVGALAQALSEQGAPVRTARVRLLTKAGGYKALQLRGRPAVDEAGAVVGHIITMQDTSERDEALRALAVLSEGNRVLARVEEESELLADMCATVAAIGQYPLVWYGRRVLDDAHTVEAAAIAGPAAGYVAHVHVSWGDDDLGRGPTGQALRTGTTQVRHDFTSDPAFAPWKQAAEDAGLRSSIALAVNVHGEIDGALMAYAEEAHTFDQRAQQLLETLASDLGLGIERLRTMRELQSTIVEVNEQRERLRDVFNTQFDPFVLLEAVHDDEGRAVDLRYIQASDAALAYHQVTREGLMGRLLSEVLPGLRENGMLDRYLSVITTGEPVLLDDYSYTDDYSGLSNLFDVRAVRSRDCVALTFRDVTQRVRASRQLAESEARYRLLAENSSDVIWQGSADGTLMWASDSVRAVLGWDPADLVGRGLDIVHTDDLEGVHDALRALDLGQQAEGEARIATADTSWRWMAFNSHRVDGPEGPVDIVALRDIDAEVRARDALVHAIGHDPLTGMAARPAMLQRIGEMLGSLRGRRLAAVLCVGVDRLSAVNEAYTHAAGDLVLTTMATRIAETVGRPDMIGRGAGVEFLVALPNLVSGDEAAILAERLLTATKAPMHIGDVTVETSVSIGIAVGDRTSDREQLTRDASAAMGQAKAEGRDRFVFADASMADQARHRLDVEHKIRETLDHDGFLAYFQPVVSLATGELTGYESLVRSVSEDGSIAPPSRFIPIAERSAVIADIDLVMLRHGLAALARLPEPLTVAVNLSTVTLTRPGYAQIIEGVVRESEVRTSRLHLEVTETALLGETAQIVATMQSISSLGPRWYVDDFGTGYSSISHLRDLPVSGLKLDVTFSAGIRAGDQKSIRLAQALAGLAGGLGLDTVAEGIETTEEAALLTAQGWRHGQGWLYGRPAPLP